MAKPTKADAELLLRLYEIRRDPEMRKARHWFLHVFQPSDWEALKAQRMTGGDEDRYIRMVSSYWDMVSTFVTEGVLNEQLFFSTSGENVVVWNKISPWIGNLRNEMKRPTYLKNLETVAAQHLEWRQKQTDKALKAGKGKKKN
jgi:Domain of unknown function (DUF4760)